VQELPIDRQDMIGELLLCMVQDGGRYHFTAEQVAGIKEAQAQTERGEFASEAKIKEVFGSLFV